MLELDHLQNERCYFRQATLRTVAIASKKVCSKSASVRRRGTSASLPSSAQVRSSASSRSLDGLPRSATVVAIRDCKLSFISREAFANCQREYPAINGYLVATLVARLREADEEMAAASFLTVKARVARALLELAEHLGRETEPGRITIYHKIRQSDIAGMAGVARENVSRTLTEWKRRGLIGQSSSYYFINDKTRLARETEEAA